MVYVAPTNPAVGDQITAAQAAVLAGDVAWLNGNYRLNAVSASDTTGSGAFVAGEAVLVTAPSVTGDALKQFKIGFTWYGVSSSVPGDVIQIRIKKGATVIGFVQLLTTTGTGTSALVGGGFFALDTPAAGSTVYTATAIRLFGTGSCNVYASSFAPMTLIVEHVA